MTSKCPYGLETCKGCKAFATLKWEELVANTPVGPVIKKYDFDVCYAMNHKLKDRTKTKYPKPEVPYA